MNDIEILKSALSGEELENALLAYKNGTPAAYILGEWEFCGDVYKLNSECLIPRLDTERVVEKVLEYLKDDGKLLDLCTGSGCIGISCIKRKKNAFATLVDISEKALEAAEANAALNGVSERTEILRADVREKCRLDKKYDIIVSNPPYINTDELEKLDEYVKKEPVRALDGGKDGMMFYRALLDNYAQSLEKNGKIIFEIGYDQKQKIQSLSEEKGYSCEVYNDYSGNPRVAVLQEK